MVVEKTKDISTSNPESETLSRGYRVHIGVDIFREMTREIVQNNPQASYAIITDSNVGPLYANRISDLLNKQVHRVETLIVPSGERSKSVSQHYKLSNELSKRGYGRDSVIIALGGGVIGDLAGYVAATHCRGVPLVQVPTSLLAQADSCIGGKVGINNFYGKNLIGVIKHPDSVWIDVSTLITLPRREIRCGLAETIKHGVIGSSKLFAYLENNADKIIHWGSRFSAKEEMRIPEEDMDMLIEIALLNIGVKGNIVSKDPNEKGERVKLNYGHTIGHAIEIIDEFKQSHGDYVSMGMDAAGSIARAINLFPEKDLNRQRNLCRIFGLPIKRPKGIGLEYIIEKIRIDKKAERGEARFVFPREIGEMAEFKVASKNKPKDELKVEYTTLVSETLIRKALTI